MMHRYFYSTCKSDAVRSLKIPFDMKIKFWVKNDMNSTDVFFICCWVR